LIADREMRIEQRRNDEISMTEVRLVNFSPVPGFPNVAPSTRL
jgi:hypothetical protein